MMGGSGGGQKQRGAQRYGQIAAVQVTGEENAAAQASSPAAAGMQEMKAELAAITSALAAIGAKKGGKGKPPGGDHGNTITAPTNKKVTLNFHKSAQLCNCLKDSVMYMCRWYDR
jgi:hypothetical protein